jgi:WhiB family redox-sensing transcriptional regulator
MDRHSDRGAVGDDVERDVVTSPIELLLQAIADSRPDWFRDAACRGLDTNLFFPEKGEPAQAKQVCETCPVTIECLALGIDERQGIWGNTSERERVQIRRKVRAATGKSQNAALRPSPINHGTNVGYGQHRSAGEEACYECRRAHAAAVREEKLRRKAAS